MKLTLLLALAARTFAQDFTTHEAGGAVRIQVRASSRPGYADVSLITSSNIGWVGFAIGTSMQNSSDMVICWPEGDTKAVLWSYIGGRGDVQPASSATAALNQAESRKWATANANQNIFVCRYEMQMTRLTATSSSIPVNGYPGKHDNHGKFQNPDLFTIAQGADVKPGRGILQSNAAGAPGDQSAEMPVGYIPEKEDKSDGIRDVVSGLVSAALAVVLAFTI